MRRFAAFPPHPPPHPVFQKKIREPLNQSAAALSGSFAPTFRFENLEIRKVFLRFSNLNLEQNPSLTALTIESEVPWMGNNCLLFSIIPLEVCCLSNRRTSGHFIL